MNGPDLFGFQKPPPMLVRLDRTCDRERPCCGDIATVRVRSDTIHAAELRCAGCDKHRGWLPKQALDFLTTITKRFGAPAAPIVLRDQTIGDHEMTKQQYDNTNSGALFRNDDKQSDKHPDYRGPINVNGAEYWISGWLKTSKKGVKFMSLAVTPKDEAAEGKKPELNDSIPF